MWANLDGRYPCYLRPGRTPPAPAWVVCVDPVSVVQSANGDGRRVVERLTSWSAIVLDRARGRLVRRSIELGRTAAQWWDWLAPYLERDTPGWIVSWQCGRVWALLGLWEALEERRVRIAPAAPTGRQGTARCPRRQRAGILVAEDPPCLCSLCDQAGQGRALWCDCRNWGVELGTDLTRGRAVASGLSALVAGLETVTAAWGLGEPRATAASQALASWTATGGSRGVYVHVHPQVLDLERAGYYGGRCECYRIGDIADPCWHLDGRAWYGWVMAHCALPVRLVRYCREPSLVRAEGPAKEGRLLARVCLTTDAADYPVRRDGDVIYPIGSYESVLCGPELADAWTRGRVQAVLEAAEYELAPCLAEHARRWYDLRCQAESAGQPLLAMWAKRVLASTHGKLGQAALRWITVPGAVAPEPWGEWLQLTPAGGLERWRALAGVAQREHKGGPAPQSVPQLASWITAWGRYQLLQAIRAAGRAHVYYVDTDSLIVDEAGLQALTAAGWIGQGQLGQLEVRAGPVKVTVHGIKHYQEGECLKWSGRRRGVTVEAASGSAHWYSPAPVEAVAARVTPAAVAVCLEAPAPTSYRHGHVGPNGRVTPWLLR